MLKRLCEIGLLCVTSTALTAQVTPQSSMVDMGGRKLHVRTAGTARSGVPTVVFESGLGTPAVFWAGVQSSVAESTRTIAYDRAGVGMSEPATAPPTVKHVVGELHALLAKLDAPPPYLLVGHSWGGPLIHSFAATFPREVAALVYIDPTDFMMTEADILALWEKAGVKNGREVIAKQVDSPPPGMSPGVLAEAREISRAMLGGFASLREAGEAPDVPTFVLLAGKFTPPPGSPFPGDFEGYFRAGMEQRVDHFSRLVQRLTQGTLVVTSKSGHFIHATEPDLVVWAIRRALASVSRRTARPS